MPSNDEKRRVAIHYMQHLPENVKELQVMLEEARTLQEKINSKMGSVTSLARCISIWMGVPNVWDRDHCADAPQVCPSCGEDISE